MSNNTEVPQTATPRPVDRVVRRTMTAEFPESLRTLRRIVLTDTMANGVPVNPSALTVVLAAHLDLADGPMRFTASHVEELLWFGVAEFCEDFGYEMPAGCPEAFHAVLAVACGQELLDDESDPVGDLLGAFRQLQAS